LFLIPAGTLARCPKTSFVILPLPAPGGFCEPTFCSGFLPDASSIYRPAFSVIHGFFIFFAGRSVA
jgi:hypothetical protein